MKGHPVLAVLMVPPLMLAAMMLGSGGTEETKAEPPNPPAQTQAGTGKGLNDQVPEPYREMVLASVACAQISAPILAAQLWAESGFNPSATSPAGAQGIAQFMPGTWAAAGIDGDGDGVADVWNPRDAIASQARYMCRQYDQVAGLAAAGRIGGDLVDLTLAAYNAGLGNVLNHGGIPPFQETQDYVQKIQSKAREYTVASVAAAPGTWTSPAQGPITSPFGYRTHPTLGSRLLHEGTDLAGGGCGGSIAAAADGTVVFAGMDQGTGTIDIDHGGGLSTSYLHMYTSGILVKTGDKVTAGQQIGLVGSSGRATGCHLHFEVRRDGVATDPEPFMAQQGAPLG